MTLSDLSLEDYYNKFKGVCQELNIYQPISSNVKTMKKQRDYMHVVCFLSGLPKILDLVKSQILASKDLPSSTLSEVFGRLRHTTLSYSSTATFPISSTDTLPSSDISAFATSMGSNRGGHGDRGMEVVNKGVMEEDVTFVSALIVMVRIIW